MLVPPLTCENARLSRLQIRSQKALNASYATDVGAIRARPTLAYFQFRTLAILRRLGIWVLYGRPNPGASAACRSG
jgi:hypothetical protein